MKNLILMSFMVLGAVTVSAQELTFKEMINILPNMERAGTEGKDYKCAVKTEWLENGDLKVTATQQYKDWKPSIIEIMFTVAKDAEVWTDKYDETVEYTISQATLLKEEDDYRVDLYESFSFDVEKNEITGFRLQIAEVDHESDPHADTIYCSLKK